MNTDFLILSEQSNEGYNSYCSTVYVTSLRVHSLVMADPSDSDEGVFKGVPISKLREHIHKLQKEGKQPNSPNGFDREFAILDLRCHNNGCNSSAETAAEQEFNKSKNRYANVLPPERTRVKLSCKSHEGSDYINANYIGSFRGEKTYIAAQGPLKLTVNDFWRMIWEQGCDTIVMLTRLKENGRYKCHKYWPTISEVFGDFLVEVISSQGEDDAYLERRFRVTNQLTGEQREIHHFQYVEWPDHSKPASTAKFREMLHRVDEIHTGESPILVHCSAGIGRTGTFCAVHSTLHRLMSNQTKEVNLPELVLQLRTERTGMVQTRDQYEFCYNAILEELEEGKKLT